MVSIIIPNYNHESFLKKRIESVLNQTYRDFELIILDDCSTDNSREIIELYRDHPHVKHIIFNVSNSGSVFKQWEKGISYAVGEFIWIAESDDYADAELLRKLVEHINQKETIGIAYCDSAIVFDDDTLDSKTFARHRREWLSSTKWENSYVKNGQAEIAENLLEMCTINNASAVLFRKQALLDSDPFDLGLRYTGDWYIYLKVCMRYDIAYHNEALNYYREHTQNTFKKSRAGAQFVREYFLIFNWVWKNVKFVSKRKVLNYFKIQTRHSLIKNLEGKTVLYLKLFSINPILFFSMILHNTVQPFRE